MELYVDILALCDKAFDLAMDLPKNAPPLGVLRKVRKALGEQDGRLIIARVPYSKVPEDVHLSYVFAIFNKEYVTWLYNEERQAYSEGHYFKDFSEAAEDFRKRPIGE